MCFAATAQEGKHVFELRQFTLEDTAGKRYNLDTLKGRMVYVDCWFPSCQPCRIGLSYSKMMQTQLQKMGMDSNMVYVTICFEESKDNWLKALQNLVMPNAIHLYAAANIYKGALVINKTYPSYRVFNTDGKLETTAAPSPHESVFAKAILYLVANGYDLKNATAKVYQLADKKITLQNLDKQVRDTLLRKFYTVYLKPEFGAVFIKQKAALQNEIYNKRTAKGIFDWKE